MSLLPELWNLVIDQLDTSSLLSLRRAGQHRHLTYSALLRRGRTEVALCIAPPNCEEMTQDDWSRLIKYSALTLDFVDKYCENWDWYAWNRVSEHPQLSPEVIQRYRSFLNMKMVCSNMPLTPPFLEACGPRLKWYYVFSSNPHITMSFIEDHRDQADYNWEALSCNHHLPLECYDKFPDKINRHSIEDNVHLTPALISEYKGDFYRFSIASHKLVCEELIEHFNQEIEWDHFSSNPHLSPELIHRYESKINFSLLSENPCLTSELIEQYQDRLDWGRLSQNTSLPSALIDKYHKNIYWGLLSYYNDDLSPELIEKYQNKLIWSCFNLYRRFNVDLINKFQDRVSWEGLSINKMLRADVIERCADKWDQKNWSAFSACEGQDHYLACDDIPTLVKLIEKYLDKWDWCNLSYSCLEYRWELIVDHPEWPWRWI